MSTWRYYTHAEPTIPGAVDQSVLG